MLEPVKKTDKPKKKKQAFKALHWILILHFLALIILAAIWISSLYTKGWINDSKVSIHAIEEVILQSEDRQVRNAGDLHREAIAIERGLWDQTQTKLDSLLDILTKAEAVKPSSQTVIVREIMAPETAKEKGDLLSPDAMHHL